MFPPESQRALIDAAQNIQGVTKAIEDSKKAMEIGQGKIDAAKSLEQGGMPQEVYIRIQMEGEAQLAAATQVHQESTKKLQEINTNLRGALAGGMSAAIGVLEAPLVRAIAQANINSQKTALAAIPRTLASVDLSSKLELQSINIRKQEVLALFNLTKSIDLDRLDRNKKDLEKKKAEFEASNDFKSAGELQKQIKAIDDQERAYNAKSYKKEFGEGMSEEVAGIISRRIGLDTKIAGLAGETEQVRIKQITDSVAVSFERSSKSREERLDSLVKRNAVERQTPEFLSMQPAQQAARQSEQAASEKAIQDEGILLEIVKIKSTAGMLLQDTLLNKNTELVKVLKEAIDLSDLDVSNKQDTLNLNNKALILESTRKEEALKYVSAIKAENIELDRSAATQQSNLTLSQSNNDYAKNKLEFEQQYNALTLDEYANKVRILEIDNAGIERDRSRIDQQRNYNKALQDLVARQLETGTIQQEDAALERVGLVNNNTIALANIDQQYAARLRLADLEKSRQDYNGKREQEYAQVFQRSMDGMINSFMNFAKTGKFSFKEMANAIIEDIIRIEMRMQLMQYSGATGGFLNLAKSFLTFGSGNTGSMTGTIAGPVASAKGNVFDTGLMKYAKGGAFTNSIVDSPTMFKFAKGTGLMGEAGPEAIMPLKRDGSGNLGVRSNQQQQNVEVVVNNYSTAQAETTETVDSRGNRKIEVVIGEMTAGEITRSGSSSQKAIRGTFGLQPQLIRR